MSLFTPNEPPAALLSPLMWRKTCPDTEPLFPRSLCLSANGPPNLYVGAIQQSSEPTVLVQFLLANLTGSTINITRDNCQNQREDEEDKESKHVRHILMESIFLLICFDWFLIDFFLFNLLFKYRIKTE